MPFISPVIMVHKIVTHKIMFEYHGADTKLFLLGNGEEFTPEINKVYYPSSPRCGTNWLIIVLVVISIFVFFSGSQVSYEDSKQGIAHSFSSRSGLSEAIKILSRYQDNRLAYILTLFGAHFCSITTGEKWMIVSWRWLLACLKGSLGEIIMWWEKIGEIVMNIKI